MKPTATLGGGQMKVTVFMIIVGIIDVYKRQIQRSVVFKLKSTYRMCDTLDSILYRMSKIIHRIYTCLLYTSRCV